MICLSRLSLGACGGLLRALVRAADGVEEVGAGRRVRQGDALQRRNTTAPLQHRYSTATTPPQYRYDTTTTRAPVLQHHHRTSRVHVLQHHDRTGAARGTCRGADVGRSNGRVRRRRPLGCPSSRRRTCASACREYLSSTPPSTARQKQAANTHASLCGIGARLIGRQG